MKLRTERRQLEFGKKERKPGAQMRNAYRYASRYMKAVFVSAATTGMLLLGCGHRDVVGGADSGTAPDSGIIFADTGRRHDAELPDAGQRPDSGTQLVTYSYTFKNLIGDFLNRELGDRDNGLTEYPCAASETNPDANPFSDGTGIGNLGINKTKMHKISGAQFTPFATVTLPDNNTAKTYSEEQALWVGGDSRYSETVGNVVGRTTFIAYTLKFRSAGAEFGIPVCTTPKNSTDYAYCANDAGNDYATAAHKLKVKFLGEDWMITGMKPPTVQLTSETQLVNGGEITLAKESCGGILNVYPPEQKKKDSILVDGLKFQLDEIEVHGESVSVIFSVLDANNNPLKKDKLAEGTSKEIHVGGKTYIIHVWKIASGDAALGARWADLSIFSKTLRLVDGKSVDPDKSGNEYWYTMLGWKNKGAGTTDTSPDHLRTVAVWSQDISSIASGSSENLAKGYYIPVLSNPSLFKFTYVGLAKSPFTTQPGSVLAMKLERDNDFTTTTLSGVVTVKAPYLHVTCSTPSCFTISKSIGSTNNFFIATSGGAYNGTAYPAGSTVVVPPKGSTYAFAVNSYAGQEMTIRLPSAGDGNTSWEKGGAFIYAKTADLSNPSSKIGAALPDLKTTSVSIQPEFIVAISERAGEGASDGATSRAFFALDLAGTSSTLNMDVVSGSKYVFRKDHVTVQHTGPVAVPGSLSTQVEGYISERGSTVGPVADTVASYSIAGNIVYARYTLSTVK